MQNASSFARMLQEAVEQGQVVLVPAPDRSPNPAPASPHSQPKDKNSLVAALCLTLKLKLNEGRMLVELMSHDYCTKEKLQAAASDDDGCAITVDTMRVFLSSMRKKLAVHDIRISTIPSMGYGLDGTARDKLRKMLAEYDKGVMSSAQ